MWVSDPRAVGLTTVKTLGLVQVFDLPCVQRHRPSLHAKPYTLHCG